MDSRGLIGNWNTVAKCGGGDAAPLFGHPHLTSFPAKLRGGNSADDGAIALCASLVSGSTCADDEATASGVLFCVSHFHAESTCTRVIDLIQEENKPEMDFVSVYPEPVIVTTAFYFFFLQKGAPHGFTTPLSSSG